MRWDVAGGKSPHGAGVLSLFSAVEVFNIFLFRLLPVAKAALSGGCSSDKISLDINTYLYSFLIRLLL